MQANRKTREGKSHPDRDAQFEYINRLAKRFQPRGQPVISVDTKKKELAGDLPARWGFLEISHPNVVVAAVKPAAENGGIVLRVYEGAGEPTAGVTVRLRGQTAGIEETDLLEGLGRQVELRDSGFSFDLGPFEIKTLRLRLP